MGYAVCQKRNIQIRKMVWAKNKRFFFDIFQAYYLDFYPNHHIKYLCPRFGKVKIIFVPTFLLDNDQEKRKQHKKTQKKPNTKPKKIKKSKRFQEKKLKNVVFIKIK